MRLNKEVKKIMRKAMTVLITVALMLAIATIGFANATPRPLKECNLLYSTSENPDKWMPVPGNQVSGFKLTIDPAVEWYYLDIKFIKPTLPQGVYMFYLTPPEDPDFWAYWDDKGVNDDAPMLVPNPTPPPALVLNWKFVMWHIINGDACIFGLYSDGAGDYQMRDALVWFASKMTVRTDFRVNGDYPKGTYTVTCLDATNTESPYDPIPNVIEDVSFTITFR